MSVPGLAFRWLQSTRFRDPYATRMFPGVRTCFECRCPATPKGDIDHRSKDKIGQRAPSQAMIAFVQSAASMTMATPEALSANLQTASRNEYSGIDELWAAERHLRTYNADLVRKLSAAFGGETEILEFGAGIGTLAQIWTDRTGTKPVCLEIDGRLRQILAARGFRCYESLESVNRAYGGVYTANVLEHIEDDLGELRRLRAVMKEKATLAVYVPAFMCLYSGLDSSVGHYRRYSKRELLGKLRQAGFEIVDSYFVDCLGFFASFAVRILGYKNGAKLGSDRNVGLYDKYVYPTSRFLDYLGLRFLFGKNLLVVARKVEEKN